VFVKGASNDDISRLGLYFHNKIHKLKFLTTGAEVGLSHWVQKVGFAAKNQIRKLLKT
jgi:hypothetical protein